MNNFKRTQQYALCIIARNRNRKLEVWGKTEKNKQHSLTTASNPSSSFFQLYHYSISARFSTLSPLNRVPLRHFQFCGKLFTPWRAASLFSTARELNWCLLKVSPFPGTVATAFRMLVDPFFTSHTTEFLWDEVMMMTARCICTRRCDAGQQQIETCFCIFKCYLIHSSSIHYYGAYP